MNGIGAAPGSEQDDPGGQVVEAGRADSEQVGVGRADLTRRNFLTKTSLSVAVGLAATSGLALPQVVAAASRTPVKRPGPAPEAEPDMSPIGVDLVAFVRNASTGEVAVMSGSREVVYHDRQLVGRLLAAARRLNSEA